ncbi:class I SAM-dependent methyltransferase [Papillibacter cinnamivorans]|uniref:tRNA (Adenine22-N1)-methyltransferase n=1 Tax=Papillibacter cinnamivorans DSM 12816 TaxID=1122930 RepID=A0A1W1ZQZ0_9FIRM|nr:class I SAM-dependent methyltransferase [Papillibacter cinnamivorans]SMC50955.1 tRNA (adenine22-N1)-methyltransferase [Papillibacter cinnamivorans DSM 12816]
METRRPELSARLSAVAEWVPPGARAADIGTDHGFLPVWLMLCGSAERVIATDLRPEPLSRAVKTAERYGLGDRIEFRLCDGLSGILPEEADTVIIAGMGGETIASILEAASWTREGKRLILQPMSKLPDLRGWLAGAGYAISREKLVRERGKIRTILLAGGGKTPPMTPARLAAGFSRPEAGEPGLPEEYLAELSRKTERALLGLARSGKPEDAGRAEQYRQVLEGLAELKKEWSICRR